VDERVDQIPGFSPAPPMPTSHITPPHITELIVSRLTTQSPLPGSWDTISGLGKGYGSYNPGFQAGD